MATFIPQPPEDDSRPNFSLEKAKDFAKRFCQPEDKDLVADIDENAREAAWRLLKALEEVQQSSSCECEKCNSEEEEEEEVTEEEEVPINDDTEPKKEVKGPEKPETSTMDKLGDIAEKNKDILDKAAKTTAAAAAAGATTQTASAATGLSAFVSETVQKVGTIGVAGTMSIGSGAYFQAKTSKEKGTEIAVVAEQEHQLFSNLNDFTENTIGFQPFSSVTDTIVEYAEEGYGDVIGTSDEDYEGGDSEEETGEAGNDAGEGGEGDGGEENQEENNETEATKEESENTTEEEKEESENTTEEENEETEEESEESEENVEEKESEEETEEEGEESEEEGEESEEEETEESEEEETEESEEEDEKKKTDLEDSEKTIELEEDDQVTQVPDVITR